MTDPSLENLIRVKTQLAEKYERLLRITSSTPRRKTYRLRAARYRRQAERLRRSQQAVSR